MKRQTPVDFLPPVVLELIAPVLLLAIAFHVDWRRFAGSSPEAPIARRSAGFHPPSVLPRNPREISAPPASASGQPRVAGLGRAQQAAYVESRLGPASQQFVESLGNYASSTVDGFQRRGKLGEK